MLLSTDKDLKAYVEEAKTRGLSVAVVHNWRVNPYFKAAATCSIEWEAFLARFVPFFMPEGAGTAAPGSCAAPAELQLDVDTTVMLEDLVEDPPIRVAAAAAAAAPGPLGPAASAEHQVLSGAAAATAAVRDRFLSAGLMDEAGLFRAAKALVRAVDNDPAVRLEIAQDRVTVLVLVRMLGPGYEDETRECAASCLMHLATGSSSSQQALAECPGCIHALAQLLGDSSRGQMVRQCAAGALKHLLKGNAPLLQDVCREHPVVLEACSSVMADEANGGPLLLRVLGLVGVLVQLESGRRALAGGVARLIEITTLTDVAQAARKVASS